MGLFHMMVNDAIRTSDRNRAAKQKAAAAQRAAKARAKRFPATVKLEEITRVEKAQAASAELARREQAASAELARRGIRY